MEFIDSIGLILVFMLLMGWNSWNVFGCLIDESIVCSVVDVIVLNGMKVVGYEYIIVDDCWMVFICVVDGSF